jgi:hypothetical protein
VVEFAIETCITSRGLAYGVEMTWRSSGSSTPPSAQRSKVPTSTVEQSGKFVCELSVLRGVAI